MIKQIDNMYLQCSCGNDTFKITTNLFAECAKCGARFTICETKPKPTPTPPEPLPPKLPRYWFK